MRAGHTYRHRHCMDADVRVTKVEFRGPNYIVVRVLYWHRHHKFLLTIQPETIRIQRSQLSKWKDVTFE